MQEQRLLGVTYSNDKHYQLAHEFSKKSSVSLAILFSALEGLPYMQNLTKVDSDASAMRMLAINKSLPRVEEYISWFSEKTTGAVSPVQFFDKLIFEEEHPQKLSLSRREYQASVANIAFRFFANNFQSTDNKGFPFQGMAYFGTIHDLLVGTKTNLYLFLQNPEELDISLLNTTKQLIIGASIEELKLHRTRHLFEGKGVSEEHQLSNGETYTTLY